jgi:hypothetical protein
MVGVKFDHIVRLKSRKGRQHYPDKLRRIRYFDQDTGHDLVFLTNRKQLRSERSLSEIIQILSVSAFEKVTLQELLTKFNLETKTTESPNQWMPWN